MGRNPGPGALRPADRVWACSVWRHHPFPAQSAPVGSACNQPTRSRASSGRGFHPARSGRVRSSVRRFPTGHRRSVRGVRRRGAQRRAVRAARRGVRTPWPDTPTAGVAERRPQALQIERGLAAPRPRRHGQQVWIPLVGVVRQHRRRCRPADRRGACRSGPARSASSGTSASVVSTIRAPGTRRC